MPDSIVWIENTTGKYDHGGHGWEFGTCVWSPAKDRRGAEGKYKIMRQVAPDDVVINCCDGRICGTSRVASRCVTTNDRPPKPGPWSYAAAYLRFDLRDYHELRKPVAIRTLIDGYKEEIQRDIETNRPKYYLFSWYPPSERHPSGKIVLGQGRFLARATPTLSKLFVELLQLDRKTLQPVSKQ